jgi:glycosyltransferase involved in cell wall biosynthesis
MATTLKALHHDTLHRLREPSDLEVDTAVPGRKIRVLYIITQLALGGATNVALDLADYFNRHPDYEVQLVTGPSDPERRDDTIRAYQLGIPTYELPSLVNKISPAANARAIAHLRRIILEGDYDIVHTHTKVAGVVGRIAARLAKRCLVFHHVHGWGSEEGMPTAVRTLYMSLERLCAGFTDRIIVVSRPDIHKGLSNRIGREDKYALVYNGIRVDDFQRTVDEQRLRAELGLQPNTKLVGMIGRLEDQKNPLDFIRAAAQVVKSYGNVQFVMIGGGPLQRECVQLIQELQLDGKFFLLGFRNDVPQILPILNLTALSSLWEGLPIAFLESICAGKPIVANHVGGAEDVVVNGETGFLVTPHQPSEMAERILYLLKNEAACQQMGEQARQRSGHFSNQKMVEQMEALYECLYSEKYQNVSGLPCRSIAQAT